MAVRPLPTLEPGQSAQKDREQTYGWELVLDLHGCDSTRFNRTDLDRFFTDLCNLIAT